MDTTQFSLRAYFDAHPNEPYESRTLQSGESEQPNTYYPPDLQVQNLVLKRSKTSRDFTDGFQDLLKSVANDSTIEKCSLCGRVLKIDYSFNFLLCNCNAADYIRTARKPRAQSNISDITSSSDQFDDDYYNRSSSSDTSGTESSRVVKFR
jgi:hypothetical protein